LQQVDPWKGEFGDAYHERQGDVHAESIKREQMWAQALSWIPRVPMHILEVGAGTGANLAAINRLYHSLSIHQALYALEPNEKVSLDYIRIYGEAANIHAANLSFDLVFTYGVLIHLDDPLPAMEEIYRVSQRLIMCAEYFSPRREAIPYRDGVPLFKDDFGSLWMDNFDLKLLGYGFCWKRVTGLDNITWWLFEKHPADGPR